MPHEAGNVPLTQPRHDEADSGPVGAQPQLLDHHRQLIEASGIRDDVAIARGYRSATQTEDLRDLGFAPSQCNVPALVIPIYNVHGDLASYQIRPDAPREIDGKSVKYETPSGSRMLVDVHPSMRPRIGDPKSELWITEGVRKADAGVSREVCVIALMGVWGWKGTNEFGGRAALPCWDTIALNGRQVYVAYDSDVTAKPEVQESLQRLTSYLKHRGAAVSIVYLPPGNEGVKVGLDDYLARGHTFDDIRALATTELLNSEYYEDNERTIWNPPIPFADVKRPRFPTRVLPDWLRDFVTAEAEALQVPVDLPAMLALSVLSITCARKLEITPKPGWREPLNTYVITCLPPGERKSPVFADVTAPIEAFEAAEIERMEPAIIKAETEYEIKAKRLEEVKRQAAKGNQSERDQNAQLASQLAEELAAMTVPPRLRLVVDDASPERLTTLISTQGGRMAVLSAEGGELFELMAGRYSPSNAPNIGVYLKAHVGDTIRVDRVGRPPEHVTRPALTLGMTVQPTVIRGLAQKQGFRGRGLLARFWFSWPHGLLGQRNTSPPSVPDNVRDRYHSGVTGMLRLLNDLD